MGEPRPTGVIAANPDAIFRGECSNLNWFTEDATSQSINQGIGPVPARGHRLVCPTRTTTYTLSASGLGGSLSPAPRVTITVTAPPPTGNLAATTTPIQRGECTDLTWMTTGTTSRRIQPDVGSVGPQGREAVCPAVTTTYTLSGSGPGGSLDPEPAVTVVVIQPIPTGQLFATREALISGECTELIWATTGTTSQTIAPGIGSVPVSGSRSGVCPTATTSYTLTATGPGGAVTPEPEVTVTVTPPRPTASLNANPLRVTSGNCSTLSWSTSDATDVSLDQGIGSVSTSGSREVCPTNTTTYTLAVSGTGGSLSPSPQVTVTVAASSPVPTGTIGVDRTILDRGECSELSWSTTDATSRSIDQGIGSVAASGSRRVCPTETTTYTLTASGSGGALSPEPTASVTVEQPKPDGGLFADPERISRRQCSTLSWITQDTTTRSIDQGIGSVAASGSRSVCPTETTTYTLTGSGPGGELNAPVTVQVVQPAPTGTLTANPEDIDAGECSTLTWRTTETTTRSIDQGVGDVAASGSQQVCPTDTTTYTLIASGPGGSLMPAPTATVTVKQPPAPGVQCEMVSVSTETPVRAGGGYGICRDDFFVNVTIATKDAETTVLDLAEPYRIFDWEVETITDGLRHSVRLHWNPRDEDGLLPSSGRAKPLIIQACPEGDVGTFVACDHLGCTTYADESDIPDVITPLSLQPSTNIVLESPWVESAVQDIEEGETLSIPISYEIGGNFSGSIFAEASITTVGGSANSSPRSVTFRRLTSVDVTPSDTGTLGFWVVPELTSENEGTHTVRMDFQVGYSTSSASDCIVPPNSVQFRVIEAQP